MDCCCLVTKLCLTLYNSMNGYTELIRENICSHRLLVSLVYFGFAKDNYNQFPDTHSEQMFI